jgi:hypothetical protein
MREWATCEPEDVPRPAYLRGISALALMGKTFPQIRYIVTGFIAEGLTVLAGAPKARKSWMAGYSVRGDQWRMRFALRSLRARRRAVPRAGG